MSSKNTKSSSSKSNVRAKSKALVPGFDRVRAIENITEYTLRANGLRVLLVRLPSSPTVTTNIVYGIGSRHEGVGETGIAHMLEHMLFMKSKTPGISYKQLEEKGAYLNASTWLDRTAYYFNMPKRYLNDMLIVEADRMRNILLTEAEFLPERSNVLSEFEMYNSRPESALEWNIMGAAFHAHTYKHDTIGFRYDIENFTVEKLRAVYDTYYWPDNATLIVVSDFDDAQVLASIKKFFAPIQRKPTVSKTIPTPEPIQEGVRRVVLKRNTPVRLLTVAFKAPRYLERDWTALFALSTYLTDGETSVLYKALVDTGLATSVSAQLFPTYDNFLLFFEIYASEKADYETIEHILFAELTKVRKKEISPERLSELKTYIAAHEKLGRDGTLSIASNLAECVAAGDWSLYFTKEAELNDLKPHDLQGIAARYFDETKATIGSLYNAR